MLHQVRDQILPDPELNAGGNTFRDISTGNYRSQVNDQNLPDLYPMRNEVNVAGVRETIYQSSRVH